jgi:D-alanyl-D-alanine carboxypeptidase/Putative Flp pilus-assembly TadE/G-like
LLLVGALGAIVLGAFVLGAVARGVGVRSEAQRAADLAALAGARAMHGAYGGLFEPPVIDGVPNPRHLEKAAYLALGRQAADATARANGARGWRVVFPDAGTIAPVRVRVTVRDRVVVERGKARRGAGVSAMAEAELAPPVAFAQPASFGDEYAGPFAERQGKRMRPDVAAAFDRMTAAARAAGLDLLIDSAYRSNAEQAALFAQHPDPKWVARPGTSLHRLGTELDLGPPAAYAWLAANAGRFHFVKRYSWEDWHYEDQYCYSANVAAARTASSIR